MLALTVPAQKMCSGIKCETLCLKCNTKILTISAPIKSITIFFIAFIAAKSRAIQIFQKKSR
jgi:hypothetical protein